jgi:hypothetical protein
VLDVLLGGVDVLLLEDFFEDVEILVFVVIVFDLTEVFVLRLMATSALGVLSE